MSTNSIASSFIKYSDDMRLHRLIPLSSSLDRYGSSRLLSLTCVVAEIWWRHCMTHNGAAMQKRGNAFAIAAFLWGESPGHQRIPSQMASNAALAWWLCLFPKRLVNTQSSFRGFETPWRSCDVKAVYSERTVLSSPRLQSTEVIH